MCDHFCRVNRDSFGGAWCPKNTISPGVREWLEVDLGSRPYRIRRTGTQGRFGGGRGQEFAELFTLEYWREGMADGAWVSYKNHTGNEVSNIPLEEGSGGARVLTISPFKGLTDVS